MTDQLSTLPQPQLILKCIVKFFASSTSAYEKRHSENTHSGWKLCFQAWFGPQNWCLVECGMTIIFALRGSEMIDVENPCRAGGTSCALLGVVNFASDMQQGRRPRQKSEHWPGFCVCVCARVHAHTHTCTWKQVLEAIKTMYNACFFFNACFLMSGTACYCVLSDSPSLDTLGLGKTRIYIDAHFLPCFIFIYLCETPVLWPLHAKSWLIGKDSDAGRDWGQEEKGTTEDEMAGWHHRFHGYEFEWTPGVGDG